ncbi:DUF2627 domain-containing protein [Erwinia piriflorinigrans]|uniref:DUF2627 domain-containing protein n=1 Tax=Erwinia piriflorinigrans TaxID=665097 RepID=UPI0009080052
MGQTSFQMCATNLYPIKNDLPLICGYVINIRVKRGTVLFMYGIFSKEVPSKNVDVEYRFLAEP